MKTVRGGQRRTAHDRRTFLLTTFGALAFPLTFPLALTGCDDDDSSDGAASSSTVQLTRSDAQGTLALPAGASVQIATVANAFASHAPAGDGSFAFVSVAQSPMLAVASGPDGGAVLYGLIQAGSAVLSTQSTAIVLAYFAVGVGVLPSAAQQAYLTAIAASPAVAALASAIGAAIVARGEGWFDTSDTTLSAALKAVQTSLSGSALATSHITSAPDRMQIQQVQGVTSDDAVAKAQPAGMIIDKTARVSGLQVKGDGVGSLTLTNYVRRRSYAYVDRVSYQTSYSGPAVASPMSLGAYPTKVAATSGVSNTLVSIAQFLGGSGFYTPVVVDGIATPIAPSGVGAVSTVYTLTSVGLGLFPGDLDKLSAAQHTGLLNVCAETVVFDIFLPILCSILIPIRASNFDSFRDGIALGALKDLISTLAASDGVIINKIIAGASLQDVLFDIYQLIVNSEGWKNAILVFTEALINSLGGVLVDFWNNGAKQILDKLSAADFALAIFDTAAVGLSVVTADLADQFNVQVTGSTVRLNPLNPGIDYPQPVSFTATVTDSDLAPGSELSYIWSCTCTFGDIADSMGHTSQVNGTSFSSTSPTLTYAPKSLLGVGALGGDQDVVTVEIFLGQINSRAPLGKVSSTITYNTPVTPKAPELAINTQQTFTAGVSPRLLATGIALQYIWTVTGGHGTVGGSSTTTTTEPTVVYTAGAGSGADTISVKVVDLLQTVYSTGSTSVTVSNVQFAISSTAYFSAPMECGYLQAIGTAGLPSDTTYRWTTVKGAMDQPNTNWTTASKTVVTSYPRANYNVPAAYPTNGVAINDKVTCEALAPSGVVLATAQIILSFGDQPYLRWQYYYRGGSRPRRIDTASPVGVRNIHIGNGSTGPLFVLSVADGNGGAVFDVPLKGGSLSGSFEIIQIAGPVFLQDGQGYFDGNVDTYSVTGGTLTVNSTVAVAGGQYIGFSFNFTTTDSGNPITGNAVMLLPS